MIELLAIPATALASYMHGQDWPVKEKPAPLLTHFLLLCVIAWLGGLPPLIAAHSALLAFLLFWLAMRRSDEAKAELDGLDQQGGRVFDAEEINRNYKLPILGTYIYSGVIYGILSSLYYLGFSVFLLASYRVPALVVDRYNYKDRSNMLSPGGSKNRALTEAIIGALPCGLCLAVMMHATRMLWQYFTI